MTRRRRSVSSPLAGISTFSGAPPGGVAGMSWIWPSVMAMVPARRERGMSASARSIALNSRVPASPCSGTVMVRSSRSGSFAACAAMAARACSASRVRSPTCMEAVWSTTSRPTSGRVSRVSCTRRGPASHSSSTAKAARRRMVPRARRNAAAATISSGDDAECRDQPTPAAADRSAARRWLVQDACDFLRLYAPGIGGRGGDGGGVNRLVATTHLLIRPRLCAAKSDVRCHGVSALVAPFCRNAPDRAGAGNGWHG